MGTGIITQASVLAQSCPCTGAVGDPRQPVLDFTTDGILPPQVLVAYVDGIVEPMTGSLDSILVKAQTVVKDDVLLIASRPERSGGVDFDAGVVTSEDTKTFDRGQWRRHHTHTHTAVRQSRSVDKRAGASPDIAHVTQQRPCHG